MPISNRRLATMHRRPATGFTLVELLVALAIIGLILASIIPFLLAQREASRRVVCAQNLADIGFAMNQYREHFGSYPRTRADDSTQSWTAFTGPYEPSPFSAQSRVEPNDVTAALWLLVRIGYIPETSTFVCPSSDGTPDPLTDDTDERVKRNQRGNFKSPRNLTYSIFDPYNNNPGFVWDDTLPGDCVLLADINPGTAGELADVTRPEAASPPAVQRYANSPNHGKAGQNVLRAGGYVEFVPHAFVGMGYVGPNQVDPQSRQPISPRTGDNIYTSLTASPNIPDGKSPLDGTGAFGPSVGPNWQYDSYLVPADDPLK